MQDRLHIQKSSWTYTWIPICYQNEAGQDVGIINNKEDGLCEIWESERLKE
jgi:hypothetical protein